jgi:AcrR family transcriptional regulator
VTAGRAPRRPYSRVDRAGQNNRDVILNAALQEFSARGFRGASIGAVAAAAAVSQSGLLHHFPSKATLLQAVIERYQGEHSDEFMSCLDGGLGFLAGLIRLVRASRDQAAETRLFLTLAAESTSPEHPAHDWAIDRYRRTRSKVIDAITESQSAGVLRGDLSAAAVAAGLLAAMDGVQLQRLIDPASVDPVEAFAAIVDAMIPALLADGPQAAAAAAAWPPSTS